ncbi:GIY-YIG nuclease family protein [bacterium]|nr:GIY-YIG nuclease family protein [bacterium]
MKISYVYILSNAWNTVLYIGVTADLINRVLQHRMGLKSGFAHKYCTSKLVYFEEFFDIYHAFEREKQLKRWGRKKKLELISKCNYAMRDLFEELNQGVNKPA